MDPKIEKWMPEARQLAAQCWCDVETEKIVMDPTLAEAMAKRIAAWMSSAAEFSNNAEFYRNIVHEIGDHFGAAARTSDDGSVQDHVLALKVPELVEAVVNEVVQLKSRLDYVSAIITEKANVPQDLEYGSTAFKSVQRWSDWRGHPYQKPA